MNINDNEKSAKTQCAQIKKWLEEGRTITSLEALQLFQCSRLASRICDLRERGVNIISQRIKTDTGKWVAQYRLAPQEEENT